MDWSIVDAILNSLAALLTGIAAIVVAFVAVLGYRKWHLESIGKRKIELAEDIPADFYKARDVIRWACFIGGLEGEGKSRQAREVRAELSSRTCCCCGEIPGRRPVIVRA